MENKTTVIHLEDLGDVTKVEVNGRGNDLIKLLVGVLYHSPQLKQMFEMALIETYAQELKQQEPEYDNEASLIEMLSKMRIGLS